MAARQTKVPAAFLSYAHLDDEAYGGLISRLRERLAFAASVAVGERFEVFQDRDGIAWGQHWPKRLDEALGQALFLIPVLTPAYFKSRPCRDELQKFLELERRSGRDDLILPIYFYTARAFNQRSDELAALLSRRQYRDWRELRHKPIESLEVRQALEQLADEIEDAIHRSSPAAGSEPASLVQEETRGEPRRSPETDHPIGPEPPKGERRGGQTAAEPRESDKPERAAPSRLITVQSTSEGRARGMRILLAEDVPVHSRLAVLRLERAGHEVDVVADGAAMVEAARRGSYDVILTEMRLPDLDGLEATRRIRALPGPTAAVPIIAVTVQALQGDERHCLDAGMNDYITKPVDWARLLGKVAEWGERGSSVHDRQAPAARSASAVREERDRTGTTPHTGGGPPDRQHTRQGRPPGQTGCGRASSGASALM